MHADGTDTDDGGLKQEASLAAEAEEDAADLTSRWPDWGWPTWPEPDDYCFEPSEREKKMITEQNLNEIAKAAGMCVTTIDFPGGTLAKAKPSRGELVDSSQAWCRAITDALYEINFDLASQVTGERFGETGPIVSAAHLAALKSAVEHLVRNCEEAVK